MNEKKVREAIEIIKLNYPTNGYCMLCEALDTAIEALEKQLPKQPNFSGDGYAPDGTFVYDTWECPCCGKEYEVDYDEYDYCPNCSQALDWSEEYESERVKKSNSLQM